jgi:hypothetical protein
MPTSSRCGMRLRCARWRWKWSRRPEPWQTSTTGYEHTLSDYERAFQPLEAQVGALFAINGRIVGLDLFDYAQTFRRFFPKLVRSNALDAITFFQPEFTPLTADGAQQFIERVARADSQVFPAVGEGEDLRFRAAGVVGSALAGKGTGGASVRLPPPPGRRRPLPALHQPDSPQ